MGWVVWGQIQRYQTRKQVEHGGLDRCGHDWRRHLSGELLYIRTDVPFQLRE